MFNHNLDSILRALKAELKDGLAKQEIISVIFDDTIPENFDQLLEQLLDDGFIRMGKKAYNGYWGKSYKLTIEGIAFINNGGYQVIMGVIKIPKHEGSNKQKNNRTKRILNIKN